MSWIKEEFQKLDQSSTALRKFGLLVGGVFMALGAFLVWRHRGAGWPFVSIGGLLVVAGAVIPKALKWVHTFWMALALLMGWVMTRVLLTIAFFLVVTPVGLLQRLFGKSPIEVAFRSDVGSYWETRTTQVVPEDYRKQF